MSLNYVSLDPNDVFELPPYSRGNPFSAKIEIDCGGEYIQRLRVSPGLFHRGIEKLSENRNWIQNLMLAERVDSHASAFFQLALCQAVEELCLIEAPKRAQRVRLIVCELIRIAEHFRALSFQAEVFQSGSSKHFFLRERESVLDLLELLSGSRFNHAFFRYGGIHMDVTEGFVERVTEFARFLLERLEEHKKIFLHHPTIVSRASRFAQVSYAMAVDLGVTGPVARAAGLSYDVRERFPYLEYGIFEVRPALGRGLSGLQGDAYDRICVRFEEIFNSVYLLSQACQRIPQGEILAFRGGEDFAAPAGFAYSRVESPRGEVICFVESDGTTRPVRVCWKTPSMNLLRATELVAKGTQIFRLAELAATMDLSFQEIDL